jgi:endonuclease/exonuclease/phosphatase family metal-dependent hydrolase
MNSTRDNRPSSRLNIAVAISTFTVALVVFSSVFFPPHRFFPAGMLSLLVPVLNVTTIGVATFLFLRRSLWAWLPTGLLLVAVPVFSSSFSFIDTQEEAPDALSVLTYNVSKLTDSADQVTYRQSLRKWITEHEFDIVCLQELEELDSDAYEIEGYHGIFSGKRIGSQLNLGIKLFTKLPMIRSGHIDFQANSFNRLLWVDVASGADTLRIITVHLKSYNFLYYSPSRVYDQMRSALTARSWHTELISAFIAESPYPVILAGDFNETPYGNAYRRLTTNLTDTFSGSGAFHEYTYWFAGMPFRIDHIFISDRLAPAGYKVHHEAWWSDHYPVSARVRLAR